MKAERPQGSSPATRVQQPKSAGAKPATAKKVAQKPQEPKKVIAWDFPLYILLEIMITMACEERSYVSVCLLQVAGTAAKPTQAGK
ncbi:hypothetical protein B296_00018868 [Ensete ventricosum]|uniref:Uncharacterized protein n=1 Tax=Ensete ventricosum TaxID=4639 RepID=A0A427A244_ENSVE|nr:hypothetical protein B296_00018868 [Ensete ventricosum]